MNIRDSLESYMLFEIFSSWTIEFVEHYFFLLLIHFTTLRLIEIKQIHILKRENNNV